LDAVNLHLPTTRSPPRGHDVAAQVEIESKVGKRFNMF